MGKVEFLLGEPLSDIIKETIKDLGYEYLEEVKYIKIKKDDKIIEVIISGLEEVINSGREAIINLLSNRIKQKE